MFKKGLYYLAMAVIVCVIACNRSEESERNNAIHQPVSSDVKQSSVPYSGYTYQEGVQQSKKQQKPMVIYFYTVWCTFCRAMDRSVFSDNAVIDRLKQNFIYVRVNAEADGLMRFKNHDLSPMEFTMMMGVRGFPTTLFLDKEQNPITKVPGFLQRDTFLNLLGYIRDECYRKEVTFESYMDGNRGCR